MYIAKKPCKAGGKQFFVGDKIPDELIDPNVSKRLIATGLLEYEAGNASKAPAEAPDDAGKENPGSSGEKPSESVKQPENVAQKKPDKPKAAESKRQGGTGGRKAAQK